MAAKQEIVTLTPDVLDGDHFEVVGLVNTTDYRIGELLAAKTVADMIIHNSNTKVVIHPRKDRK